MKKCVLLSMSFLALIISGARATEIPKGVIYKEASSELNSNVEKRLRQVLDLRLPLNKLPDNWDNKRNAIVVGNNLGNMVFKDSEIDPFGVLHRINMEVPMKVADKLKFAVYGISKPKQLDFFSRQFWQKIKLEENYNVRKLTNDEMLLIWFFIGWDLDEPIFVVEDSNHTLVFDFTSSGEQLDWIEDIKDMKFTLSVAEESLQLVPRVVGSETNKTVLFMGSDNKVFYVVE